MTTLLRDSLRTKLEETFRDYPDGLIYKEPFDGIAFFPGGYGVHWDCDKHRTAPDIPRGGVMIVGNDFGKALSTDCCEGESNGKTWTPLKGLLREAEIPLSQCFFTNAYMGLRDLRNGVKQEGCSPGIQCDRFVKGCRDFFLFQLRAQQPQLVIALGTYVPPFLAPLAPQLEAWEGSLLGVPFRKRDEKEAALIRDVAFRNVPDVRLTVVSLVHPVRRKLNSKWRKYAGLTGHEAEVRMLLDAKAHRFAHYPSDYNTKLS